MSRHPFDEWWDTVYAKYPISLTTPLYGYVSTCGTPFLMQRHKELLFIRLECEEKHLPYHRVCEYIRWIEYVLRQRRL